MATVSRLDGWVGWWVGGRRMGEEEGWGWGGEGGEGRGREGEEGERECVCVGLTVCC